MLPDSTSPIRKRLPRSHARAFRLGLAVLGIVIGLVAYMFERAGEVERTKIEFRQSVALRAAHIEKELVSLGEALHSLRALYDASTNVTREEFATFAAEPLRRFASIRALAWVPVVADGEREAHTQQARSEGIVDYAILDHSGAPAPAGRLAFPALYVVPKSETVLPLGFDLGTTAAFGAAIARAALNDTPMLSDPVLREGGAHPLVLMLLRVNGKEGPAVGGFVAGAVHPAQLLHVEDNGAPASMALELSDPDASGTPTILGGIGSMGSGPWAAIADVHAASQTWRLRAEPTATYLAASRTSSPVWTAVKASLAWAILIVLAHAIARRGREEALKKRDRSMSRILASLDEGVVVVDGNGRTLFFNDAAERILGRGADIGKSGTWSTALGLLPDDTTTRANDAFPLARALKGEVVPEREILVRDAAGGPGRWVSVSGAPLQTEAGEASGAMIVLRDVSQKKRSQQAIRRLSRAVNHTADAVYIADEKGRLIYVNPAFERMTGYARRDAVGGTFKEVGLGGGDAEHIGQLSAAILSGKAFRGTTVNERRDGRIYHGEQTLTPMLDARGGLTHWVGVCRDMTEIRRLEEQRVEMELASKVQRKLYPVTAPKMRGFEIAGAVYSAEATCGDYFDFIEQSDTRVAIAVGDVSGHGLGPALVMTQVRACLRAFMQMEADLDNVFERINLVLQKDFEGDFFVTLLVIVLDLETREIHYCNAGHIPAFVLDADGRTKATLGRTGIPLGILADRGYEIGYGGRLDPGDVTLLLTDGVVESRSKDGDCLWEEGAVAVVEQHVKQSAADIVERLYERVRAHSRGRAQDDDVTIVVLKALDESCAYVRPERPKALPRGARGALTRHAI